MAQKKTTKKGMSGAEKAAVGIGLTAAAVAAAGTYFLYGSKNAAKNRKVVKGWALRAKGEVLEAMEKAEHMTEKEFDALVAGISKTYGKLSNVSKNDVAGFQKEMMSHWKDLSKTVGGAAKKATKTAKKVAKKTAKKVTKKVAKKK